MYDHLAENVSYVAGGGIIDRYSKSDGMTLTGDNLPTGVRVLPSLGIMAGKDRTAGVRVAAKGETLDNLTATGNFVKATKRMLDSGRRPSTDRLPEIRITDLGKDKQTKGTTSVGGLGMCSHLSMSAILK